MPVSVDRFRSVTRHLLAAVAVLALGLVSGCGGESSDKAGGKGGDVRVLRLANANAEPGELAAYAEEVERVSDGRLKIEFLNDYRRSAEDAEPGILDDVRAGKVDLAWVGARAFAAEGVDAFDPLIAPFQVTDYETEQQVLADPAAREMLDAVDEAGVQGVALLPGPLRWLGMREPWSGPDDLAGKRISAPAGIGSRAIAALGAKPVVGGADSGHGGLDGAEEHLPSLLGNFYAHEIPNVGSLPLWPRPLVVVASPKAWKELDERDRGFLTEAGTSAVLPMLNAIRAADKTSVPKLCRQGMRVNEPDARALRAAVEPVLDGVREDPRNAKALDAIERVRVEDPPPVPACDDDAVPETAAGLPPGRYEFVLTEADKRRREAGKTWKEALPERFAVEITPGHMLMHVTEHGGPTVLGLEADFSTFKDRIDIDGGAITGRWSVDDDGNLRFSDIEPSGEGDDFVFATKPWRRVR